MTERVAGAADVFKAMPGRVAFYLVRSHDGTLTSAGVFESREAAEASRQVAARWVTEHAADLLGAPAKVIAGEVIVLG